MILEEGVKIVFTSAGNPATYTARLKDAGITVVHVIANVKFAQKAEEGGVDALVAEGFEAGGHNGREETTTLCLVPLIRENTSLPLIAAGGIASGAAMSAMFALGAEGVQVGSLFAASQESSASENFKQAIVHSKDGDTMLTLKVLTPVRMLKNAFYEKIAAAQAAGASAEALKELLGKGRSRKGIFEGDMEEGELEIGQAAAGIHTVKSVNEIMKNLLEDFHHTNEKLCSLQFMKKK